MVISPKANSFFQRTRRPRFSQKKASQNGQTKGCNDYSISWIPTIEDHRPDSTGKSKYDKIHNWLRQEPRFYPKKVMQQLSQPNSVPAASQNNPIFDTTYASALLSLIKTAKNTIFADIFLFGGSFGVEVSRQLLLATQRGVEVVILHDTESGFGVDRESEPVWNALVKLAEKNPKLVTLRTSNHHPNRPSAIPFGLEKIIQPLLASRSKTPLSLSGRSDHSKIIVTDGFTASAKACIGSKNWIDSAAMSFHDEAVVVHGQPAAAILSHYIPDIRAAQALAAKEDLLTTNNQALLAHWYDLSQSISHSPNNPDIRIFETNIDSSRVEIEGQILKEIAGATTSIDLYGRLIYNPRLNAALAMAQKRGVIVRAILDQAQPSTTLLNSTLPLALRHKGGSVKNTVRWYKRKSIYSQQNHSEIVRELHAKTIIFDGKTTMLGSCNFDAGSFTGGFRETNILINSVDIAQKARDQFNEIWSDEHTITHEAFLQTKSNWLPPSISFLSLRNLALQLLRLNTARIGMK